MLFVNMNTIIFLFTISINVTATSSSTSDSMTKKMTNNLRTLKSNIKDTIGKNEVEIISPQKQIVQEEEEHQTGSSDNTLTVLTQNMYGLPLEAARNHQEHRWESGGKGLCRLSPDVIVLQEFNAVDNKKAPERINNMLRKTLYDCGYKYQLYEVDPKQSFASEGFDPDTEMKILREEKSDDVILTEEPGSAAHANYADIHKWQGESTNYGLFGLSAKWAAYWGTVKIARSGILMVSKYPLSEKQISPFNYSVDTLEASGEDKEVLDELDAAGFITQQLAKVGTMPMKGFKYATVTKSNKQYGIIGTHLDPYLTKKGVLARKAGIKQINQFIAKKQKEKGKDFVILVAGDFNTDYYLKRSPDTVLIKKSWIHPKLQKLLDSTSNKFLTDHGSKDEPSVQWVNQKGTKLYKKSPYNHIARWETYAADGFFQHLGKNHDKDPMTRLYDLVLPIGGNRFEANLQRVRLLMDKKYEFKDRRGTAMWYSGMRTKRRTVKDSGEVTDHDGLLLTLKTRWLPGVAFRLNEELMEVRPSEVEDDSSICPAAKDYPNFIPTLPGKGLPGDPVDDPDLIKRIDGVESVARLESFGFDLCTDSGRWWHRMLTGGIFGGGYEPACKEEDRGKVPDPLNGNRVEIINKDTLVEDADTPVLVVSGGGVRSMVLLMGALRGFGSVDLKGNFKSKRIPKRLFGTSGGSWGLHVAMRSTEPLEQVVGTYPTLQGREDANRETNCHPGYKFIPSPATNENYSSPCMMNRLGPSVEELAFERKESGPLSQIGAAISLIDGASQTFVDYSISDWEEGGFKKILTSIDKLISFSLTVNSHVFKLFNNFNFWVRSIINRFEEPPHGSKIPNEPKLNESDHGRCRQDGKRFQKGDPDCERFEAFVQIANVWLDNDDGLRVSQTLVGNIESRHVQLGGKDNNLFTAVDPFKYTDDYPNDPIDLYKRNGRYEITGGHKGCPHSCRKCLPTFDEGLTWRNAVAISSNGSGLVKNYYIQDRMVTALGYGNGDENESWFCKEGFFVPRGGHEEAGKSKGHEEAGKSKIKMDYVAMADGSYIGHHTLLAPITMGHRRILGFGKGLTTDAKTLADRYKDWDNKTIENHDAKEPLHKLAKTNLFKAIGVKKTEESVYQLCATKDLQEYKNRWPDKCVNPYTELTTSDCPFYDSSLASLWLDYDEKATNESFPQYTIDSVSGNRILKFDGLKKFHAARLQNIYLGVGGCASTRQEIDNTKRKNEKGITGLAPTEKFKSFFKEVVKGEKNYTIKLTYCIVPDGGDQSRDQVFFGDWREEVTPNWLVTPQAKQALLEVLKLINWEDCKYVNECIRWHTPTCHWYHWYGCPKRQCQNERTREECHPNHFKDGDQIRDLINLLLKVRSELIAKFPSHLTTLEHGMTEWTLDAEDLHNLTNNKNWVQKIVGYAHAHDVVNKNSVQKIVGYAHAHDVVLPGIREVYKNYEKQYLAKRHYWQQKTFDMELHFLFRAMTTVHADMIAKMTMTHMKKHADGSDEFDDDNATEEGSVYKDKIEGFEKKVFIN